MPTPSTPVTPRLNAAARVATLELFPKDSLVQADDSSNSRACHHAGIAAEHASVHRGDGEVLEETQKGEVLCEDQIRNQRLCDIENEWIEL